ncbi:hydrogen peroxide-inducible genes activator [Rhodobacteraceae bacterium DSL-40]|uniref:hydrogen peroxide-inducible genes activator n=1 Tax=Amaricoccus sp. B4 TaxID=3368557 RepID=UPI000DAB955B
MKKPVISIRQLSFVAALAEELNFSRAAKRCQVSQPTLSTGLRECEMALGVQIAERTRRSVILTPAGREIAARARVILAAVRDLEDLATQTAAGMPNTPLRLGAIPTVGPYLLPHAMPEIRTASPDLKFYLREELAESLRDGLASGRLDAILLARPFDLEEFHVEPLFEDGFQIAMAADAPHPVAPAGLEGARLLLLDEDHCLHRHTLDACPEMRLQPDRRALATGLPTLASMVAEGLGATLLPQLAIDGGAFADHRLSLVPLEKARPREVVLAWRKTAARGVEFGHLAEILRQTRQRLAERAAS